ncbi:putative C-type lectin domain family 20 member A [Silurus meridionalis]|uniref:putative C-type lectin domain family 20 member A n=1 Tax=Silurus meridionalis TaxID=175797 RepID=UPI001EECEB0A|nr:putative C-type lectin domain family 20 member A [Silurus meridionalis]XP_046699398.1 putative C-type lectin domain family 20 member A [Silurus meridionalis]
MKLELILLCLTGILPRYITLSTTPHKYYLVMTQMTWSDAQNYCKQTYVDIAVVASAQDWLRLAAVATTNLMTAPAWIGMYNNVNSWRWSYSNLPLTSTSFTNWGSPPSGDDKACVSIDTGGSWLDSSCSSLKPFICYDSAFTGFARFIPYVLPPLDWYSAQAFCRQFHTDLPTSSSSSVNTELKNRVVIFTTSWIGLFRDTWTWTDGTIASSIPWALFQPNFASAGKNCVTYTAGTTSDQTCTSLYAFFCHSILPVKKRQIVRLQVKSDVSVFDPVLQSSILEQIKGVLKNNGMNVTVTWRVQPKENIFYKKIINLTL